MVEIFQKIPKIEEIKNEEKKTLSANKHICVRPIAYTQTQF